MGRKTFRARPSLSPHRWYFVPTETPDFLEQGSHRDYQGYGYFFCASFEQAMSAAKALADHKSCAEVFIVGGVSLFEQAALQIDRLYRTTIHEPGRGQRQAPPLPLEDWREITRDHQQAHGGQPAQTFQILERP
jgi:dihydrofolate reductase